MEIGNYFFMIFFITVLITRLFVYLNPVPSPTIKGFRTHHYMYGIILFFIAILINNVTILGIGFGLFIDELTYILIGGKTHEDNYSKTSLIGTLIFVILVFFFRNYIVLIA